jgi:hypothetical protein
MAANPMTWRSVAARAVNVALVAVITGSGFAAAAASTFPGSDRRRPERRKVEK